MSLPIFYSNSTSFKPDGQDDLDPSFVELLAKIFFAYAKHICPSPGLNPFLHALFFFITAARTCTLTLNPKPVAAGQSARVNPLPHAHWLRVTSNHS